MRTTRIPRPAAPAAPRAALPLPVPVRFAGAGGPGTPRISGGRR